MNTTAIHEAGHAVAHVRHGLEVTVLSVRPDGEKMTAGHCRGPGVESVRCAEDAEVQILAYLAGYAALIAYGLDEESASRGAESDMEYVEQLLEDWCLGGGLNAWKERAVEFMSRPENVAAVALLAKELEHREHMVDELIEDLISYSDGEFTEDEWQRYLLIRQHRGLK